MLFPWGKKGVRFVWDGGEVGRGRRDERWLGERGRRTISNA